MEIETSSAQSPKIYLPCLSFVPVSGSRLKKGDEKATNLWARGGGATLLQQCKNLKREEWTGKRRKREILRVDDRVEQIRDWMSICELIWMILINKLRWNFDTFVLGIDMWCNCFEMRKKKKRIMMDSWDKIIFRRFKICEDERYKIFMKSHHNHFRKFKSTLEFNVVWVRDWHPPISSLLDTSKQQFKVISYCIGAKELLDYIPLKIYSIEYNNFFSWSELGRV